MVRRFRKTWKLRVRRVRCKGCGRTHALLPSFCYSNRRDCSETIWGAIIVMAGGRGPRPVADRLGLPHPTVRSWLRRLRDTAKPLRHHFVVLSESFSALASRAPPEDSLVALVDAVKAAHFAATSRLGEDAAGRGPRTRGREPIAAGSPVALRPSPARSSHHRAAPSGQVGSAPPGSKSSKPSNCGLELAEDPREPLQVGFARASDQVNVFGRANIRAPERITAPLRGRSASRMLHRRKTAIALLLRPHVGTAPLAPRPPK